MKRSKIKTKYLDIINDNYKKNDTLKIENTIKEKKDISSQIKAALTSFGLIFLLTFYIYIPLIPLALLGINYDNFSYTEKLIYATICSILFLIFLIYIYRKELSQNFKDFFNKNIKENLRIPIKYWLLGLGIMITSNLIISIITNGGVANNEESVRQLIDKFPLYMVFQIIIYAPITEELIFRKSFKEIFNNAYLYIITSGLVFGGLHVITSITTITDLLYIVPYSALGIAFAYTYNKTNNIFSTISMHSLHNFLTLILYLVIS